MCLLCLSEDPKIMKPICALPVRDYIVPYGFSKDLKGPPDEITESCPRLNTTFSVFCIQDHKLIIKVPREQI
jgi:hypothetical protein